MSSNKICFNCGCTSFVSDRSLGGKIVCVRCGSSVFKEKLKSPIRSKKIVFLIIGIIVFFLIII